MMITVVDSSSSNQAHAMGFERGESAGSWAFDGNSSIEDATKIIEGYNDGDPEVMDMCPSPLSGEWADDPTPNDVLDDLGVDPDDESADDLLDEYEAGFQEGFWNTVLGAAAKIAGIIAE